jgi:hypothetical protein
MAGKPEQPKRPAPPDRPKQAGRPTREAKPREKSTLSLRVTPTLKTRLDDAGKQKGRNLSQEAELRLENSFRDADAFDQVMTLLYGPTLAVALVIVGRAVLEISRYAPFPQSWTDHANLIDEAAWAAGKVFAAFGLGVDPPDDRIAVAKMIVAELLAAVRNPEQAAPALQPWARPLHAKLSAEMTGRIRHDAFITASPGKPGRLRVRLHLASPASEPIGEPPEHNVERGNAN